MNTRGHPYKLQTHFCKTTRKLSFFGRVILKQKLCVGLKTETVCSETINDLKNNLAKEWSDHDDMYGYTFSSVPVILSYSFLHFYYQYLL